MIIIRQLSFFVAFVFTLLLKFSKSEIVCEATYEQESEGIVIKFTCPYNDNIVEYMIQDDHGIKNKCRLISINAISHKKGEILDVCSNESAFNSSYNIAVQNFGESLIIKVSSSSFGKYVK